MPIPELDNILKLFSEQDRATVEQLIERNEPARTRLTSQDLIYRATIEGETQAANDLAAQQAAARTAAAAATTTTTTTPTVTSTSTPALDLKAIEALLDSKLRPISTRLDTDLTKDRLKEMFTEFAASEAPKLLGQATANADLLYIIRGQHKSEFGEELDRTAFETFVNEQTTAGTKFPDWSKAHDAYVSEKRIAKRIEQGVAEKLAAAQTQNVPGTTIPSTSGLGRIFEANPTTKSAAQTRGEGLNGAAAAFRALRQTSQA